MIPRPTTDTLLHDCCRELSEHILPAIEDESLKLRLVMTVTVLENAAVRAAHEIAWLRAESEAMTSFARDVAASAGDPALTAALAATATGPADSLLLHDVVDSYERACRAFDAALQVAQRTGRDADVERAAALLRSRIETEKAVMAGYAVVGR